MVEKIDTKAAGYVVVHEETKTRKPKLISDAKRQPVIRGAHVPDSDLI